jgi:hypothetical protein
MGDHLFEREFVPVVIVTFNEAGTGHVFGQLSRYGRLA